MLVSAAKAREAAEVLGVELDGLTPKSLASAYRTKAKECHPDQHGSTKLELWARVDWANQALKRWLEATPPAPEASEGHTTKCRACNSSGRVNIPRSTSFGRPLTMQCMMCKGSGRLGIEQDKVGE